MVLRKEVRFKGEIEKDIKKQRTRDSKEEKYSEVRPPNISRQKRKPFLIIFI